MQSRASRLGQAAVCHFACERVLEDVLDLSLERRALAPVDEVACLERLDVRGQASTSSYTGPVQNTRPITAAACSAAFSGSAEHVDARREHRLHRVRYLEARRHVVGMPPPSRVPASRVDQAAEDLLDEEGISFRPFDDDLRMRGGSSPASSESTSDSRGPGG